SATEYNWKEYRSQSESTFVDDRILKTLILKPSHTQQDVDIIWKSIITNTREVANTTFSHKLVKYHNLKKPIKLLNLRPSGSLKHVTALRKIIRQLLDHPTI